MDQARFRRALTPERDCVADQSQQYLPDQMASACPRLTTANFRPLSVRLGGQPRFLKKMFFQNEPNFRQCL